MPRRVQAIIEAVDRASGPLGRVASSVKALGAVAAVVGAGAIGRKLVQGLEAAARAAGKQEEAETRLAAVIKSTGGAAQLTRDQMQAHARALQDLTGVSDEVVIGQQALLATFTNIKGGVFKEATQTILDMSAALDQDLKSSTIQLGKALNDPILGVTALQRVGVSFTESQREQIRVLVESGKTMEAQRLILDELGKEFGGQAAARLQTFEGRIEEVEARFGDLQEVIGGPVLEVGRELLGEFVSPLIKDLTTAGSETQTFRTLVLDLAAGLGQLLKPLEVVANNVKLLQTAMRVVTSTGRDQAIAGVALWRQLGDGIDLSTDKSDEFISRMIWLRDNGPQSIESTLEGFERLADIEVPDIEIRPVVDTSGIGDAAGALIPVRYDVDLSDFEAQILERIQREHDLEEQAGLELLQTRRDQLERWSDERLELDLALLEARREQELEQQNLTDQARADIVERYQIERDKLEKDHADKRVEIAKREAAAKQETYAALASEIVGALTALFGESKAAAVAQAIIDTWAGVNRALATYPPPLSYAFAAAVAAKGLANVSKIQGQEVQRRQEGGFIVPGPYGGGDRVPALLSPGELVLTPAQQAAVLSGQGSGPLVVRVEMGPNLRRLADDLSVEVERGSARLVSTTVRGPRSVR